MKCSLLKFKGGKYYFRVRRLSALSSLSRNRKKYYNPYHYFCYEYSMYVIIIIKLLKIKRDKPTKTNYYNNSRCLKHGFPKNCYPPPIYSILVMQKMI